jgi:predicted HicB family RNase H-like nuclease
MGDSMARKEPRQGDITVKLNGEVARRAKMVAAARDISLAEYLSELLAPLVAADMERELSCELEKVRKGGKP